VATEYFEDGCTAVYSGVPDTAAVDTRRGQLIRELKLASRSWQSRFFRDEHPLARRLAEYRFLPSRHALGGSPHRVFRAGRVCRLRLPDQRSALPPLAAASAAC